MKTKLTQWAAIRQAVDDKHEFIDVSTVRCLQELSMKAIEETALNIPLWHAGNPVVRYSMVEINEL